MLYLSGTLELVRGYQINNNTSTHIIANFDKWAYQRKELKNGGQWKHNTARPNLVGGGVKPPWVKWYLISNIKEKNRWNCGGERLSAYANRAGRAKALRWAGGNLWQDGWCSERRGGATTEEAKLSTEPFIHVCALVVFNTLLFSYTKSKEHANGASSEKVPTFIPSTWHDPWNSKCLMSECKAWVSPEFNQLDSSSPGNVTLRCGPYIFWMSGPSLAAILIHLRPGHLGPRPCNALPGGPLPPLALRPALRSLSASRERPAVL